MAETRKYPLIALRQLREILRDGALSELAGAQQDLLTAEQQHQSALNDHSQKAQQIVRARNDLAAISEQNGAEIQRKMLFMERLNFEQSDLQKFLSLKDEIRQQCQAHLQKCQEKLQQTQIDLQLLEQHQQNWTDAQIKIAITRAEIELEELNIRR